MYSERDFSLDEAILRAKNFINQEQLNIKVKELPVKGTKLATYRVFLGKDQKMLHVGNGKGITKKESFVSALYESLEHYYYSIQRNNDLLYLKFGELKKQDKHIEGEYWFHYLERKKFEGKIATYSYEKLSNEDKRIKYPSFLTNIYFTDKKDVMGQYPYLNYYSNNNGCASGSTLVETLIHSLSEVIERDSVSEFIMNNLVGGKLAREINVRSLPQKLKDLVKNVKNTVGSIHILDITEKGLIPTFLAYVDNSKKSCFPIIGCGSSLNSDYALSRAVTECLQTYQLVDFDKEHDDIVKKNLNQLPQMYDLIRFKTLDTNTVNYDKCKITPVEISNVEKLKILINLFEKNDYSVYYRVIFQTRDLYVTQTVVPGFDSFNLLLEGQPVMPNRRTRSLLNF